MKKILFVLGTVVVAASMQAASVKWTVTNVFLGNETDKASGVAFFLTTDVAETSYWSTLKGADAFTSALAGAYNYTPTTAGTYSSSATNEQLGLQDATQYTAYLLVFDTDTITDSSKFFVTSTKGFTTYTGTSTVSVSMGTQKTASQAAAAWGVVAVPEPTTVALLALGLAAVGLKRKVA